MSPSTSRAHSQARSGVAPWCALSAATHLPPLLIASHRESAFSQPNATACIASSMRNSQATPFFVSCTCTHALPAMPPRVYGEPARPHYPSSHDRNPTITFASSRWSPSPMPSVPDARHRQRIWRAPAVRRPAGPHGPLRHHPSPVYEARTSSPSFPNIKIILKN